MDNHQSNKPNYDVLHPSGEGEKVKWLRVGAAWNCSNDGISLVLNSLPVNWDGRLVLMPPKPKKEAQ